MHRGHSVRLPGRPVTTHVALLRGINVGGKNVLPMKDLAALFATSGCERVRTYIQSGNVVFDATPSIAKGLSSKLHAAILKRFGLDVPVALRTGTELRDAVAANPFLAAGAELDTLHLSFLATAPSASAIATLDPKRSPGDEFVV
ncbi:MAG: DUF1697 domain-containing protein, partial [Deltaproteobacteria bacterium]